MSSVRANRLRKLFVVSEVALAFVALAGAGLFIQSLRAARSIPTGLDTHNVLVFRFYTSASGYNAMQREQFCLTVRGRLEAAPGIVAASYADTIPLGFGLGPGGLLEIEGYVPSRGENMTISRSIVAPGYFRLLRVPLLEGRDFTARDARDGGPVLIVNETFARRYFAGTNPVGRRIRARGTWFTVIGLARDSKYYYPTEAPRPYFYASSGQADLPADVVFYVRTAGDPENAIATLRREAAAVDPAAAAFDAMPLADYVEAPLFPQRIAAGLLSVLGALSLILAAVGLYSVMTYTVTQRTPELGIRMALGARPGDVLGMVIRQGMVLAAGGLAVGLAAALAAARLVRGALINVSPADPLVFAGAAFFLGTVALLACYVPARRATRVDPVTALRCQ
jgi:predicted permease